MCSKSEETQLCFELLDRVWEWGAPGLLPEGTIHTKSAEKVPVFLSTESLHTGDWPHPWLEQAIFSAPALPAAYPRFVSSVSPREQFYKAGRCSPAVPGQVDVPQKCLGTAAGFAAPPAAGRAGAAGEAAEF